MNRPLHLGPATLDALRITAALAVMGGHLSTQRLTGGLGWQLGHYGPSRVVVFLVLSGFLVAASLDRPHRTPRAFATARLSRVASVALPALVLTAALDALGAWLDPAAYADVAPLLSPLWLHQYARALTLSTVTWGGVGSPGSNWAWWTLGVELSASALYGVLVFARGRTRIALAAAVLLAAGPVAALLAPAWLMGAAAYHAATRLRMTPATATALALTPLAAWLAWEASRVGQPYVPRVLPHDDLALTVPTALGLAACLAGTWSLAGRATWTPHRLASALRWTAGATFTLYLTHMPIGRFLAAVSPHDDPAGWPHRALVLGGVLLAALALAEVTERRRAVWRRGVERVFVLVERMAAHGRPIAAPMAAMPTVASPDPALIDRLALALRQQRRAQANGEHFAYAPTLRERAVALLAECEAAGIKVELRKDMTDAAA